MSFFSWCQIVRFIMLVPNCPGAKLSGDKLSVFIMLVPNCPSVKLSWCQIVRCQIVRRQIVLSPLVLAKKLQTYSILLTKNDMPPPPFHFQVQGFLFIFSRLSLCSRNKLCEIRSVFRQGPAQHYNTFQHAGKVYCLGLCVSGVCIVFHDATFTLWELFNNKTDPLFCFQDKNRTSFHKFFIWRKSIILLSSINDLLAAVCQR